MQTTRCTRCRRPLRKSVGMGPVCARRAAAERQYKPHQVDKARELAADHGIVDTGIRTQQGRRVFQVISSNGVDRYFTTIAACTCPHGLRAVRPSTRPARPGGCYHMLAARFLAA